MEDHYEWLWLYAAAEPATGESFYLYMPHLDGLCFGIFLEELRAAYPGEEIVLVLDGAPAHRSGKVAWPDGIEGLRTRKSPGRQPNLTEKNLEELSKLLKKGPVHFGFRGETWTRSRAGAVIRRVFGVQYCDSHVGRLLKKIGWSLQKPTRRASQRKEEAIEKWVREDWPRIKKADKENRTVIFVDEAGFCVLPAVVRTWAPRGQRPVVKAPFLWEHLSVIGAITPEGKLYQQVQERAIRGPDVVPFLRHLMRHVEGRMTVVLDGLPAHRGMVVKQFLREESKGRIHLERLPGYAQEGIWNYSWNYLKRVKLKSLCCESLAYLRYELRKAKERLRHKPDAIRACFQQVGLV